MARILIIDDDDLVRDMLRRMLERAGYEVVDAPDGKRGAQIYRAQPTDLIVTDLFMPEQEGLETIMELRRDFPHVKIVAISGGYPKAAFDGLPLAKQFGALRTFAKPFDRQKVLTAIQELLAPQTCGPEQGR